MAEAERRIAFPALSVSRGDSFMVVHELPGKGTATALRNGYFERLYLLDSDGLAWEVKRATPRRSPTLLDRALGRIIAVSLEFSSPQPADVSGVVADLCALIDADPDDLYNQRTSREALKARLRLAATAPDLIRAVEEAV